jgi:hypothetical protein
LSTQQQAQRKLNARSPIDVQVASEATQKYQPQEQLLQGGLAQSAQDSANVGAWFKNYQDTINASSAAIQQAYQKGQQDVVNIGQGLSQAAGSQGAANDQSMAADAANRGTTVAPGVAQVGQQASGVRRDLAGSFAGMLASQGVGAQVAGADRSRIASGQGLEAQLKELQNRRGIQGQQISLAKDKGNFKVTEKAALTDAAHKSALEDKAFGLNVATKLDPSTGVPYAVETTTAGQKSTAANAAAGRKAAGKRWAETVNKYGVTNGAWADYGKTPAGRAKRDKAIATYKTTGGKTAKPASGPGSLSAGAEIKSVQRVKSAAAAARHAITLPSKTATTPAQKAGLVRAALANGSLGQKYTADEINAAMDLLPVVDGGQGGLSAANVKALHRMGIHVNGNFPIAKPPPKVSSVLNASTLKL